MRNRIKLNIIKYNKAITKRLNIVKKEFEAYKSLKELNLKFNLNIKDIDIEELDLNKKYIEN